MTTENFSTLNMANYLKDVGLNLPLPLIGVDDGYNQINVAYWVLRDGKLTIAEDKIMSRGKRGKHLFDTRFSSTGLYSSGEDTYTISDSVGDPEDTRTDEYPKIALSRFLVHAALNKIGLTNGQQVAIATGLPIKVYKKAASNERLIEAKTKNMQTPVLIGPKGTPSAIVRHHSVFPEAVAGIVDYLFDEHGAPIGDRDPNAVRMALDIGGNTTDMAIILPGTKIGEVETIQYGVSHMRDRLEVFLEEKLEMKVDSRTLDEALETRQCNVFGDLHDVSKEWDMAIGDVLVDIFAQADALRRRHSSVKEMVCFGGGAALCRDLIKARFPNVLMLDNPDGANARGFLKCATFGAITEIIQETGLLNEESTTTETA